MAVYTILQLLEVLFASCVLVAGVAVHSPSIALLGGGLLIGKAILNILAPEGGTVYRRSVIGYGAAAIIFAGAVVLVHFAG